MIKKKFPHYHWQAVHPEYGELYIISRRKPKGYEGICVWRMRFSKQCWTFTGFDSERNRFICRYEPPIYTKSKFRNRIGWRKEAYGSIV